MTKAKRVMEEQGADDADPNRRRMNKKTIMPENEGL
jgi:hypothetical protein